MRAIPGEQEWGAVRALNPATAQVVWEQRLFSAPWSGLLSTAGNIVFGATNEGQFYALHAATGKPLWRFQAGGQSRGNPDQLPERRQTIHRHVHRQFPLRVRP